MIARVIASLFVGMVVYIVSDMLIDTLITGTTAGDTIFQDLVPIALAMGIIIASLAVATGIKKDE